VCLNSAYGALGNEYFRFFDVRQAEGITLAGQLSIRWIGNKLNEYLNTRLQTEGLDYVIASDTDSVYLELEGILKKVLTGKVDVPADKKIYILDRFCNELLQPFIEKSYKELAFYVNAYEQKMEMKRESLADKEFGPHQRDIFSEFITREGVAYTKPKIGITGLEVIKSNTPASCRKAMLAAIDLIMDGKEGELHKYTEKFRKEFMSLPVDEISFPSGVKHLSQYSDKNTIYGIKTPAHVKACLLYNHKLKQLQLHNKYPLIPEGEKIKWLYLKKNNPIGDTVIGFIDIVPPEFGLENFFDRSTQFEKAFIDKLTIITSCIGWSVEKQAKLDI
jgi:DNA polymerase elongation subunit (family B)